MSRESGGRPARRRLFLAGLVVALIPMTAAPHRESTCDSGGSFIGSLVCAPIDLLRALGPLARYLLLAGK